MRRVARGLGLFFLAAGPLLATTYNVTNVNDSGAGSLRQAILDANGHAGADTIAFNIPGSGVHTIVIASNMDAITSPVTIDGYTQSGASPNTHPVGQGLNTVLRIEIDCTAAGGGIGASCMTINGGAEGSIVRGLVVNRSPIPAIIANAQTTIEGCFVGTDPTGTVAHGNGTGLRTDGGTGTVFGGTTPAARNLISGNGHGILFGPLGFGGSGHFVQGNLIGTDISGLAAIPNNNGIGIAFGTTTLLIGGTDVAARNVISGNSNAGLTYAAGTPAGNNAVVEGNFFGTDVTGMAPLPNLFAVGGNDGGLTLGGSAPGAGNVLSGHTGGAMYVNCCSILKGNFIGVAADGVTPMGNAGNGIDVYGSGNTIGGPNPGDGNVIAYNGAAVSGGAGIVVMGGGRVNNSIRGNAIFENKSNGALPDRGLGISLNNGGPSSNDPGDSDGGGNLTQNWPIITSAVLERPSGNGTRIQGVLRSAPSTTYDIDFYSNPACSAFPKDYLEGRNPMGGSTQVTTDASGNASFDVVVPDNIEPGELVTATATDPNGNTSEFSQRLVFGITPGSGPATGGTAVSLYGSDFAAGATVTIGGQPVTSLNVPNSTTATAEAPALLPGSVNDVAWSNTDGTAGTLLKGFVADFLDVPPAQQFYGFITKLVSNAITAGVGGGNYGVDQSTLRQQMAVFLLKGKHGLCYVPPPCAGTFGDVPCPSTFANWIEALAAEGITGGCGSGNFCPGNPVRRDQMAAFLLRAEHGAAYTPPDCAGIFTDVACPSLFANWIEQLATEQITGGCGGGNYCPLDPSTRGQMAVFVSKTFKLQ